MPQKNILYIKLDSNLPDEIYQYYNRLSETSINSTDSGIDLPLVSDYSIMDTERETFNFGIKCEMIDNNGDYVPYFLYPRSSISKTPLILANSVGIIDKDYRGHIMAKVVCIIPNSNDNDTKKYCVSAGTRLFQICSNDLSPIHVKIINELTETERGEGGFGSTGVGI